MTLLQRLFLVVSLPVLLPSIACSASQPAAPVDAVVAQGRLASSAQPADGCSGYDRLFERFDARGQDARGATRMARRCR